MSDTDSMFPDADAFIDEEELKKIVEDTKQKILVFGVGGAGSNTISMMAQKKDLFVSESAEVYSYLPYKQLLALHLYRFLHPSQQL